MSVKPEQAQARFRSFGLVIALSLLALLATACSGPSANGSSTGNGTGATGYLASTSSEIVFLQWTVNQDNSLHGTAQEALTSGSPPDETSQADQIAIAGQLKGDQLTLSFGSSPDEFGSFSGGTFTINVPQSDGTFQSVTFRSGTVAQYNQRLARLHRQITAANEAALKAEALQQEQQKIDSDVSRVQDDLLGLAQAASSTVDDANAIATNDLPGVASDLSATQAAEQQVLAEAPSLSTCGDAKGVGGDAEGVGGDAQGIEADGQGIVSDLQGLLDLNRFGGQVGCVDHAA
jgi:hypothetical protein